MTKNINKPNSTPGNITNRVNNFTELNFKEVNVGGNKIAWTFFTVNIDESYGQLGSKNYPSYFYIKTESGNIYKIFRKESIHLTPLVKDVKKYAYIQNNFPTEWCIYNPQTRKITAVENTTIECGKPFAYAPKCATSPIKEIVGVSGTETIGGNGYLKSTIEQEFTKKMQ